MHDPFPGSASFGKPIGGNRGPCTGNRPKYWAIKRRLYTIWKVNKNDISHASSIIHSNHANAAITPIVPGVEKGGNDKYGHPTVRCTFPNEHSETALFDTGASTSFMAEQVFKLVSAGMQPKRVAAPLIVKAVNGAIICTVGTYEWPMQIQGKKCDARFTVTDNTLNPKISLGVNNMQSARLAYHPLKRTVLHLDHHEWDALDLET